MVRIIAKIPFFLDAFAYLCKKKRLKFLIKWARIMIGSEPKLNFFKPNLFTFINYIHLTEIKKKVKIAKKINSHFLSLNDKGNTYPF